MWIRTQDREALIKCKYFDYECVVSEKPVLTLHSILGGVSPNGLDTLAIYATKERCLEVLDEIEQQIVKHNTKYYEYIHSESNKIEYTYNDIPVYQMPKE